MTVCDLSRISYESCRAYKQSNGDWSMPVYEGLHHDITEAWTKVTRFIIEGEVENAVQAHTVFRKTLEGLGWTYEPTFTSKRKGSPELQEFEKLDRAMMYTLFLAVVTALKGEYGNYSK